MSDKHARDKIMQMTPEELREAIAEARGYIVNHNYLDDYGVSIKYYWIAPSGLLTTMCPDWTVYITDAWELVDDMRENGCEFRIDTDRTGSGDDIYNVAIFRDGSGTGTGWTRVALAEAPTAPLAISRCWLMWKEEK